MKKILPAFIIVISSLVAQAQYLTGPTSVKADETHTYEFSRGVVYPSVSWIISNGTVVNKWNVGHLYYATVTWTSAASNAKVIVVDQSYSPLAELSVNVAPNPSLYTPNVTYAIVQHCGSTDVTRNGSPPSGVNWYWQTSSTGTSTALGYAATLTRATAGALYLRPRWGSTGSWGSSSQYVGNISIITSAPAAPATATDGHRISNSPVTVPLSVSTVSGVSSYRWYTVPSGGSPIAGQNTTSYSPLLSATTVYYVSAGVGSCESARKPVTGYVYPEPVVTVTNNGVITMGRPVTLSVSNQIYDSYEWLDAQGNGVASGENFEISQPGEYRARVTKNGAPAFTQLVSVRVSSLSGQNANFIVSNSIQVANITDASSVAVLPVASNSQTVQYFDGLGRPVQTVVTQGSPAEQDIVQPVVYDALGRENRKYLPFVASDDGHLKTVTFNEQGNYTGVAGNTYSNNAAGKIAQDLRPFSETAFEFSPLSRPLQENGPGKSWVDNDKNVTIDYQKNTDGTTPESERIIIWRINAGGLPEKNVSFNGGFYPTGNLYVKVMKDEQSHRVREYTDKQGRVILKKVQAVEAAEIHNDAHWAQTYYIYDDFGNLVMVLPPEAVKALISQ